MEPYKIDVPVLLIFFCRPDCFGKVFDQVRVAKPSKLFLYQDGPRINKPHEVEGIERCRTIAEQIDWQCEVHRFYQKENVGCDPSEYIAIKWMFEFVDRGIILEDDDVPSKCFFPFCAELLEKYKDDARVSKIQGLNHKGIHVSAKSDYIFSNVATSQGWATWKRCTDLWQEHLDFLDDEALVNKLAETFRNKRIFRQFLDICKRDKKSGIAHYESINEAAQRLNGQVNITAAKNLITNIGITPDATHTSASLKMAPRAIRRIFDSKRYEIEFPLKHPKEIKLDYAFEKSIHKLIYPSKIRAFCRSLESEFLIHFCNGSEGRRIAMKNWKRRFSRILTKRREVSS